MNDADTMWSSNPIKYLKTFTETLQFSYIDISKKEEYLVKVHAGVKSKPLPFGGLQHEKYTDRSSKMISLPLAMQFGLICTCIILNSDNIPLDPK